MGNIEKTTMINCIVKKVKVRKLWRCRQQRKIYPHQVIWGQDDPRLQIGNEESPTQSMQKVLQDEGKGLNIVKGSLLQI